MALECGCDYSYICPTCQARIDAENQAEYMDEMHEWIVQSISIIATELKVSLPEPPQKRGRYKHYE